MEIKIHPSINDFNEQDWNALWPSYPFVQYGFLNALEASHSVNTPHVSHTGWQPFYVAIYNDINTLIFAAPIFIKTHSYGEYVFDWSWANAYADTGLDYYPKLLNAIPFTPATGPRFGFHSTLTETEKNEAFESFLKFIQQTLTDNRFTGFHCLFPSKEHGQFLQQALTRREGYQFHWFNKPDYYTDFDDFLATFTSRKRKNVKKEREKVTQQNLTIEFKSALEVTQQEWDVFYTLYHRTYLKRSGGAGYLGKHFFHLLAKNIPEQLFLTCAYKDNTMIAGAVYLRDDTTLYGRYWGAKEEVDGLHFECCYYQGIEYAIRNRLLRFDPGAQGEHKIQRGFTPIKTQSYHLLAIAEFNQAIKQFVLQEQSHVDAYLNDARTYLPFKAPFTLPKIECLVTDT